MEPTPPRRGSLWRLHRLLRSNWLTSTGAALMTQTLTVAGLVVTLLSVVSPVQAQWLKYPTPGTPRLPDGKPNLSAPVPRAAGGRPDLTGVWEVLGDLVMPTDGRIRSKYVYNIGVDLPGELLQVLADCIHLTALLGEVEDRPGVGHGRAVLAGHRVSSSAG